MRRIQRLDVGAYGRSPISDDAGRASGAAWLVTQLPAEDGGTSLVAVDDKLDVVFVGVLRGSVGVEVIMGAAVDVGVGVDAAKVVIVVEERQDELDAFLLSSGDGVVEAGNAVIGVVIEVLAGGVEDLVVNVGTCAGIIDSPKAPDSGDFIAGL